MGLLLPYEEVAFNRFKAALLRSTLPLRRPSNTDPTFWSDTLTQTAITPLAQPDGWTQIMHIHGVSSKTYRVSGYVTTVVGDASIAGVEFRIVLNGAIAPNIVIASGTEHNKKGPAQWPVVPQETFFLVEENDNLIMQARCTNVIQQMVLGAFFGWVYNNPNPAEKDIYEFITDDT